MNKLLLNNNARNHIKIMALYNNPDVPDDEGERIRWCEKMFNNLQNSDKAVRIFSNKHVKKGFAISVWELDGLYYLIQSIRNEFGTYNNVIYINDIKEDTLNIAKFLKENAIGLMNDYRKQILEANEHVIKNQPIDTEAVSVDTDTIS